MAGIGSLLRKLTMATLLGGAMALGGCGAGGLDLDVDAPILEAAGISLSAKKKDDEDLPERPGLVVPPSVEKLPAPGTQTAAASQNWPQDPDQLKKRQAAEAQAAEEKYCAEGEWGEKASISEFNKNVGQEARCPSKLGKAINNSIAKSDTPNR